MKDRDFRFDVLYGVADIRPLILEDEIALMRFKSGEVDDIVLPNSGLRVWRERRTFWQKLFGILD